MPTREEIREDEEAREKYRGDWIKAEYEVMGWWPKIEDVAVEPLIKE